MDLSSLVLDPASFRDPEGSVFFHENKVYRTFNNKSLSKLEFLINSSFFEKLVYEGKIIKTEIIKNSIGENSDIFPNILHHQKISFITYPYEWSFYMLKEAALLTLFILKECLKNGFILKDGTAWNITFNYGKMCFFDILSIDLYKEGQTWNGYNQFCKEFLYPLFITAYKGIDFHSFFKGNLQGIESKTANAFFNVLDWRYAGIFKYVFLNSKLTSHQKIEKINIRNSFLLPKKSLINIIDDLTKVISNLHPNHKKSIWRSYTKKNTYSPEDTLNKKKFIQHALKHFKGEGPVIDLGCNTGDYSIFIAEEKNVLACDVDPACIDQLYIRCQSMNQNIIPFVLDLMNPSSSCGWRLNERSSIFQRLKPNSFLALALIHHICITSNVPLENFIGFLFSLAPQGVIEWVDKKDPMVQFLLRNRDDIFSDYSWHNFEKSISKYFKIKQITEINGGTRKLCLLVPLS